MPYIFANFKRLKNHAAKARMKATNKKMILNSIVRNLEHLTLYRDTIPSVSSRGLSNPEFTIQVYVVSLENQVLLHWHHINLASYNCT